MAYGDCLPLFSNDIWLECTFLPSVIVAFFFFFLPVSQTIYLSFLIQPYDNENPPYVKVRHDHLYTYSFTILYVYRDMQRMTQ